jgi:hypothetical protein
MRLVFPWLLKYFGGGGVEGSSRNGQGSGVSHSKEAQFIPISVVKCSLVGWKGKKCRVFAFWPGRANTKYMSIGTVTCTLYKAHTTLSDSTQHELFCTIVPALGRGSQQCHLANFWRSFRPMNRLTLGDSFMIHQLSQLLSSQYPRQSMPTLVP